MMRVFPILIATLAWAQSTLPPWTPGTLDIHQISTGRGNAAFFILPDGTTMLVDAGAAGDGIPQTDPHPDASRRPGEWIARYISRHLPPGAAGLDYVLITHFHVDHMGGIADVGAALPIRTLIDRGWPDYSYPAPLKDNAMAKYRRFLAEKVEKAERFAVGSDAQIRLKREDPLFRIRNIIANGELWTGNGTRRLFPPLDSIPAADVPNENMCSLGIRLEYGAFRYFTGGDLPGTPDPGFPAWHAVEAALGPAVGRVDVHVVNQHGSMGEESDAFLAALGSTVLIIPSWAPSHPAPDVLKRIVNSRLEPSKRYVFATDLRDAARIVIGARVNSLAGPPGHIVVRVAPGGASYSVFVLDHRDERDTVIATQGPFRAGS
ncbi:MAG: MBL fold metallo-hydrolase [Acidobacteriia bacterium]|nr:MBL fold metallo-hydrolase [Terriglobia bacterium]